MTRTSTFTERAEPIGVITPSWSTRRTLACAAALMSPTSSRNSVPPSASSNLPTRSAKAPVNEPFTWPNSSDSISSAGMAAQLTSTKARARARREPVHRPRHQLLPRAVLPGDQQPGRRRRHLLDPLDHLPDRGRGSHDLVVPLHDRLERAHLPLQHDVAQRVLERQQDAVRVERLLEEVVGAELGRLDRGGDGPVAGDHHDQGLRVGLAQLRQDRQPVHPRHLHVEQDEVRLELGEGVQRLGPGAGQRDRVALVLEQLAQRLAHALLVVHHQDAVAHRALAR